MKILPNRFVKSIFVYIIPVFGIILFATTSCLTKKTNKNPVDNTENNTAIGSEVKEISKGSHGLYFIVDKDPSGNTLSSKKYFFIGNSPENTKVNMAQFSDDSGENNFHQILLYLKNNYNLDYYEKNIADDNQRYRLLMEHNVSCCYFDIKYSADEKQVLSLKIAGKDENKYFTYQTSGDDKRPGKFADTGLWRKMIKEKSYKIFI